MSALDFIRTRRQELAADRDFLQRRRPQADIAYSLLDECLEASHMRALARYWRQMALVADTRAERLERINSSWSDRPAKAAGRDHVILNLSSEGWTNRAIAKAMGLHEVTICRILGKIRPLPPLSRATDNTGSQRDPEADKNP
jgi:hypothetical protein